MDHRSTKPIGARAPEPTETLKTYFEHLFANSRDIMNLFSLTQGRIIMLNEAAEDATGYTREELASLPLDLLYPAEELPKLQLAFERLRSTGYSSEKLRMYARDGELRDIWTRSYVIQHEPEAICLVHTIDMTEENRKRERELRNARLATLGESSATLAHELKNALQSMQFSLGTMRAQLQKQDTKRTEASLARLERAVKHMDDVIAGVEKGARGPSLHAGYVSVVSAIEDALSLLRGYLEAKSIEVSTEFEGSLPLVWCDLTQVEQILIVLIKNAAQAMASREQRRLCISARTLGERVRVEVADTGGGIPAEIEGRVFKAFATTKPLGVGMGLGLANARQLASANGIELSFASTRGVGTTFALEFGTAGHPAGERSGERSLSGRILLVVGDDPECLGRTRAILESAGAQALLATSQAEAVQLLRVHSVEAIVCDDAMYPVRGREFAAQMRDIYRGPICLLAAPEASDALGTSSAVDAIVAKPIDAQALVESLSTLVR